MKCPFCNNRTRVYNSRTSHQSTQTWRRRQCLHCNKNFTTREKVDFTGVITVRSKESLAPYSRERLLLSIVRASDKLELPPETASELTDSVESELKNKQFFSAKVQEAEIITAEATIILARYDKNLAIQYLNKVYSHKPPLELLNQLLTAS